MSEKRVSPTMAVTPKQDTTSQLRSRTIIATEEKMLRKGNFSSVPQRDEFLENARLFIFETYCRIHQRIDVGVLVEKLNLNYEEAERWIVNLIRTSKHEAKIDSETGTIIIEHNHTNVYEQLVDHTKVFSLPTYKLVNQLSEHAQRQTAR
ncbi:hypothetical protein ACS0TY_022391 [Phlomoides rotata]